MDKTREELAEGWIQSTLSAAERKQVELDRKTDPTLDELIKKMELTRRSIIGAERQRIYQRVQQFEEAYQLESSTTEYTKRWPYAIILLGLVLLVGFIWWWSNRTLPPKLQNPVVAEYFSPTPFTGIKRTTINDRTRLLSQAATYYDQANWTGAIDILQQLKDNHQDTLSQFYLGVSYLGNGQPQLALQSLTQFAPHATRYELRNETHWHQALATLEMGDVGTARVHLQSISSDSYLYNQAKKLIQNIQ